MWRRLTVLLLLRVVIIDAQYGDVFQGCLKITSDEIMPGLCTFVPEHQIRTNETYYKTLVEAAMQKFYHGPTTRFTTTALGITRVAHEYARDVPSGVGIRLEFLTVPGNCTAPGPYSITDCTPLTTKVNGLCQAKFLLVNDLTVRQASWCRPIR